MVSLRVLVKLQHRSHSAVYANVAPHVLGSSNYHICDCKRKRSVSLRLPPVHCAAPFAGLSPCGSVPAALQGKGNPCKSCWGRTRERPTSELCAPLVGLPQQRWHYCLQGHHSIPQLTLPGVEQPSELSHLIVHQLPRHAVGVTVVMSHQEEMRSLTFSCCSKDETFAPYPSHLLQLSVFWFSTLPRS